MANGRVTPPVVFCRRAPSCQQSEQNRTCAANLPHERDVMEYRPDSGLASLRLDVEGPDDVAPLLGFVGDELAKVGGREREHVAAQVGKPRLDLGISEASVDLLV